MSRRPAAALLALTLASAASCKKDSPKGLPPANDWSSSTAGTGEAAPAPAPASPHANPHGPGVGAANPHGPGMTGGNPHEGVTPGATAGGDPHDGPVPQKTAPRTLEKLPDGRFALGPFSVAVPAGWTEKPITSSMRAAQFALSTDPGAEAELIVYYFGVDGAGGVQDNIDRWLDQFQQAGGKRSKDVAKLEQVKLAGQDATIVSVSGRYVTTSMPGGGDAIDKPDQSLIGAIVASPKGPYYFKLVGAKKTVDAQAAKLRGMLTSIKLR